MSGATSDEQSYGSEYTADGEQSYGSEYTAGGEYITTGTDYGSAPVLGADHTAGTEVYEHGSESGDQAVGGDLNEYPPWQQLVQAGEVELLGNRLVINHSGHENRTAAYYENFGHLIEGWDDEAREAWTAANPDVMLSACNSAEPAVTETDLQDVWEYGAGASDADVQTWLEATDE